jgi:hypothetical protein
MVTEIEMLKNEEYDAVDKRLGYRKEVARAEIRGNEINGIVFFFSTPIGMMICAEINCSERYEGTIFRLIFNYGVSRSWKKRINQNLPLMYIKNGKGWLRYMTAKLNFYDIIGEDISICSVNRKKTEEFTENTAIAKITLPNVNKAVFYNLNHA